MTAAVRLALAAIVALLAVAGPVAAQDSGPALEVNGIDLSEFPTVRLRLAVGADVATTELDADRVDLTENGEPVDEVVTPLSDQVVAVLLAIDTSGSMAGDALLQAEEAALELIDTLPSNARVAVVGFGTTAELLSGFTTDRAATRTAIQDLTATGGTSLYDAVVLGAQETQAADADRRALLVLSDGADSDSSTDLEGAVGALESTVGDFFAVALETGETDPEALAALADAARGRVVPAEDPDALAAAYVDLGQRIVNQYRVEFVSTTDAPTATYTVGIDGSDATTSVELALPDRPAGGGPDGGPDEGAAPRPFPEPLVAEAEPSLVERDWVLYVGAPLVGIAIAVALALAVPRGDGRRRERPLRSDATVGADARPAERALHAVRDATTGLTGRVVDRTRSSGAIDAALDRAGLVMRSGEFVALVLAVALGAAVLLSLLLGPVLGAVGLVVPLLGASSFLRYRTGRRNRAFADQLGDTLLVMSGSLRSGFGVGQAIDTVAEEMEPPISTEFRRAILETRLGRNIEDALDAVAERVQNEDFGWVVDAMRINRQVGGDLAAILDQVAETIRARNRLERQVAALTAEGRISALVLGVLPVAIALVLYSSNPDYLDPLFTRTAGQIMLASGVGLLAIGALWLRKLIDIEY